MSVYAVPSPYSPPMLDGTPSSSTSSLPETPKDQHGRQPALSLSLSSSSSLPPSLGKLMLNRSASYNASPSSSFGSSSASSCSSLGSVASSGSTSSILTYGSSSIPRPHGSSAYTNSAHASHPMHGPPPHSLGRDKIVLPPLEPPMRHLASASARVSPPAVAMMPTPQSTRQPTSITPDEVHRMHAYRLSDDSSKPRQQRLKEAQGVSPQAFPRGAPPPNVYRPAGRPASTSEGEDVFGSGASGPSPPPAGTMSGEYPLMSMVVRKRRRRTTPQELAVLDGHFAANPLPTAHEREVIANEVNMTPRHIQIWFQNKRQTEKKRLFSEGYADRPPRSSSMTLDQTSSSSPAQLDTSGLPSSSSPSTGLSELPKQDGGSQRYTGGKENIPPLARTASSASLRAGGPSGLGTPTGSGSETGASRSSSRTEVRAEGSSSRALVATKSASMMDEVVGSRELPFQHGAPSTLVRGAKRPEGLEVWKNMMSDPPSGGLEEMIPSDDDAMDRGDDEGDLTDQGEGDSMAYSARSRPRTAHGGIPGIRSTLSSSYTHSTPLHPSSLARRLSTTSTASSGSTSTPSAEPASDTRSVPAKVRTSRPTSVTTSLTSSARQLGKTHSAASGLLTQGPNGARRVPTHLAGERGPSMRRSASLDWAASRAASSPRAVSVSSSAKARPSRLGGPSASHDVVMDGARRANGATMESTPRPFKRVKTESDARMGSVLSDATSANASSAGSEGAGSPAPQPEAKKAGVAAEDEECARLLLGLFSGH